MYKEEEVQDTYDCEFNEHWTQSDMEENIQQLNEEIAQYLDLLERVQAGWIPSLNFKPSYSTDCYLFGCGRHQHRNLL